MLSRAVDLNELTIALGDAATSEQVARVILDRLIPKLGAEAGTVALPVGSGLLRVIASHGYDSAVVARFRSLPIEADVPLSEVARTREPLFFERREQFISRYPQLEAVSRSEALFSVPLLVRNEVVGVLGATFGAAHPFPEEERSQVILLAGQCALALQRVQALKTEVAARKRIEALAEVSQAFAAQAHDLPTLLQLVARRVSELFAQSCSILLIAPDGVTLEPVALHHVEPEAAAQSLALFRETKHRLGAGMQGMVAESGKPMLVRDVPVERIIAGTRPEYRELVRRYPPASFIVVPLRVRGRVIGTLSVSRGPAEVPFAEDDVAMVTEVADRAAQSIENARLLSETQRALAQAQEAIQLREEFLSIAGHELKTPITSLKLELQLHARAGTTRPIDRATRQVQRLESLVQSLLDVGRIGSGRMDVQLGEVDVVSVLRDVADRFQVEADAAGSALVLESTAPVLARCDRERFDQVVTNLVSNGLKYGGGKPVRLSAARAGDTVRVTIRDEGIGIDPEARNQLFERFARSEQARRHYGGIGLGLWISRQLMERMHGRLDVHSAPGAGATFTCELPASNAGQTEGRP